jgi:hypothetical protein
MSRRRHEIVEDEDGRPLDRRERLRQWDLSPEGRFEARLQRLYRHRDRYTDQIVKMEDYLRKHPEVREFVPDWLRVLLATRQDVVEIGPARAHTPADFLDARLMNIGRHRAGIEAELKYVEKLLAKYPNLRSPVLAELLSEAPDKKAASIAAPSKAVRRRPRLIVNNVIPVTRPQLKRERLDDAAIE